MSQRKFFRLFPRDDRFIVLFSDEHNKLKQKAKEEVKKFKINQDIHLESITFKYNPDYEIVEFTNFLALPKDFPFTEYSFEVDDDKYNKFVTDQIIEEFPRYCEYDFELVVDKWGYIYQLGDNTTEYIHE